MDLNRLKQFCIIVKAGSITKAAEILNISQPSLSRSMDIFEYTSKLTLLKRTKKGITLTADGERTFDHAERLLQEHEFFLKNLYDKENEIRGEIRIITTPFLAELQLNFCLLSFLEKYPDLKIKVMTITEDFEIKSDTDVGIRTFIPYRPDLEQLYLQTHHQKLWASAEYLEKFGIPKTTEDLDHHRLLAFGLHKDKNFSYSNLLSYLLYIGQTLDSPRQPFYQITSHGALHEAACKGYGIAQLPKEWVEIKKSPLIEVLPDLEFPKIDLYFIFNKKLSKIKRISALYEHLSTSFKEGI